MRKRFFAYWLRMTKCTVVFYFTSVTVKLSSLTVNFTVHPANENPYTRSLSA